MLFNLILEVKSQKICYKNDLGMTKKRQFKDLNVKIVNH